MSAAAMVAGAGAHTAMALAMYPPRAGHHALDVGCGCGATTIDLARLVGPAGEAVGLDRCEASLAIARHAARAKLATNASFVCGDAHDHSFDGSFDLLVARFGTMLFPSPWAALASLRHALRPRGRLLDVAWRSLAANPWAALPNEVALRHLPAPEHEACIDRADPFFMADPDVARSILEMAGYEDVRLRLVDLPLLVGRDVETAIEVQLELGRAGEIVRAAGALGEQRRGAVAADLRAALAPYLTPRGVIMPSSTWCITATNPG